MYKLDKIFFHFRRKKIVWWYNNVTVVVLLVLTFPLFCFAFAYLCLFACLGYTFVVDGVVVLSLSPFVTLFTVAPSQSDLNLA